MMLIESNISRPGAVALGFGEAPLLNRGLQRNSALAFLRSKTS